METIKRTVRVIIEKEIEIELRPSVFGNMTIDEYLDGFRKSLWHVDSIDDVIKYAARMAAYYGGGMQHDGIGMLDDHDNSHRGITNVKFIEIYDECEEEIV